MPHALSHREFGRGRPVVFVHGFPFHGEQWDAVVSELAPLARCIVPDLFGFGRSTFEATAAPDVVTMEQHADDLSALLDTLEIRESVVFIGFSMGGYAAWPFFRKHRNKLRALALCNTRAIGDAPQGAADRAKMAAKVLTEGRGPLVESMVPKLFAPATLESRPEVVASVRGLMEAASPRAIASALRGMAQRSDATALLSRIDVPTLVVAGQHDAIASSAEMRGIATAIPGSRFVEIADAGHMTTHENPKALNQALREFLSSLA